MDVKEVSGKISSGLALDTTDYHAVLNSLKKPPLLVNDLDTNYPEDEELLNKYLLTTYDTATFSMVPSCECGHLVGGHLRGKTCSKCNSEVLTHTEVPIESNLWIKVPDGVVAFMSPTLFSKLSQTFETNKVDVIRWICDIHYKGNFHEVEVINKLREAGVKRGYNNFINNFWEYIDILLRPRMYTSVSDKRRDIRRWLEDHKDTLFTEFLPLPNRISLVTEKTSTGRYGEILKFGGAVEAARTITSLKTRIDTPSQSAKEAAAFRCVYLLAAYYRAQQKDSLGRKEGLIRKHICGTRMPFSARNVITSLHAEHEYNELHVPWAMAIGLLRLHLTNKLFKDGYSPNEITGLLTGHVNRYHPLIDKYMKELIAESPYKGLPCCFNRNPTLLRGSIQQLYITKIKSDDINDNTISLSVMILASYNAEDYGSRCTQVTPA